MSLYVHREICCDWNGFKSFNCTQSYYGFPGDNAEKVRKEAKAAGWTRVHGHDFCPDHKETL